MILNHPTRTLEQRQERARRQVMAMPDAIAGQGGTVGTMRAAGCILRHGLSVDEAWPVLLDFNRAKCSPPWREDIDTGGDSLRRLLCSAAERPSDSSASPSAPRAASPAPRPKPAAVDILATAKRFAQGSEAVAKTWQDASEPGATVAALYAPGELVNVVTSAVQSGDKWRPDGNGYLMPVDKLARPGDALRSPNVQAGAWMRPNPVKYGGGGSRNEDVASFRFVLMESDSIERQLQLTLLWRLRELGLPVAALVDSGGKSYHAWVHVDAPNSEAFAKIAGRLLALPLGFDKQCRNPSRLSRFPGAMRGEVEQRCLYLAPSVKPLDEDTLAKIEATVATASGALEPAVVDAPPVGEVRGSVGLVARSLFDLQRPKEGDGLELLRDRLLCRCGGLVIIGQTGQGKSSLSMQAMLCWAVGRALFGIRPSGPLKCLLLQAENDDGDLSEARDGVAWWLDVDKDDDETRALLTRNTLVVSENGLAGASLLESLDKLLDEVKPDLLLIDPLFAFMEGDTNNAKDVGAFLRRGLNPLLTKHQCGCVIVHHTAKPPTQKGALNTLGTAYAGAGSAELPNWARAVLTLEGIGDSRFKLNGAKRGGRIGWKDADDRKAFHKIIEHSTNEAGFCWKESSAASVAESNAMPKKRGMDELLALVPLSEAIDKDSLVVKAQAAGIGIGSTGRLIKAALGDGVLFEHQVKVPGRTRAVVRLARFSQAQAGELSASGEDESNAHG